MAGKIESIEIEKFGSKWDLTVSGGDIGIFTAKVTGSDAEKIWKKIQEIVLPVQEKKHGAKAKKTWGQDL